MKSLTINDIIKYLKTQVVQESLLALFSLLLFTFQLGKESLWLDEIYTYYASNTFSNLIATVTWKEKNMWLFHILMYFWKFIGPGETIMRSLAVLFAICGVISIYRLGVELSGKRLGLIAGFLLALSTYSIRYAQEARAYSLIVFLCILSSLYFLKVVSKEQNRDKFLYVLFTGLAIHSHLFALFFIFVQFSFMFYKVLKKSIRWETFIQIYVGIGLFFTPLVLSDILGKAVSVTARTKSVLGWIPVPHWDILFHQYYYYASESASLFAIYLFLISYYLFISFKTNLHKEKLQAIYLVMLTYFPMIFIFLISVFVKPIYVPRYVIFTLPGFILLVAKGLFSIKNKNFFWAIFTLILIFNFKSIVSYFYEPKKEQWRQGIDFIAKHKSQSDIIEVYPDYLRLPFNYYSQTFPSVRIIAILPESYTRKDIEKSISKIHQNVWFISRVSNQPAETQVKKVFIEKTFESKYSHSDTYTQFNQLEIKHYSNPK